MVNRILNWSLRASVLAVGILTLVLFVLYQDLQLTNAQLERDRQLREKLWAEEAKERQVGKKLLRQRVELLPQQPIEIRDAFGN